MKKRKVLFFAFILLSNNLIAQIPCSTLLIAVRPKEKKDNPLCGTYLMMDSSKFIYIHSGCEQHSFFALDRFHVSNDSIYLDRFDFMHESPFVYIKTKASSGGLQKIKFLSIEGKKFEYRHDEEKHPFFAVVRNMHDRKRRLNLVSSTLTFPNGSVKVLDISLLERIFGVPEPLWIKSGVDYEIKLNVPYDMLESCLHKVSNFSSTYLLIRQNQIVFPSSGDFIPIMCRKNNLSGLRAYISK
jgi:hypothetical protein